MKPAILLLSFVLIGFTSACGQTQKAKPTPTLASTAANTPRPAPTIPFTYTPHPTNTPIPTEKIAQATDDTTALDIPTQQSCEWKNIGSSPDNQWLLEICVGEMSLEPGTLRMTNATDGRQWQLDGYYGKSNELYPLDPRYWSQDGAYLFLGLFSGANGPMAEFFDGSVLLRFNLNTGAMDEILPEGYYSYAFSSNNRLAYIYRSYHPPQFLNTIHLATGAQQSFSLGSIYCGIGHLMWSPQNDRIIFTAATCAEYPYIASLYSFVILDLVTGDYHTFYSSPSGLPRPLKWEHDYPMYQTVRHDANTPPECWVLNLDVGGLLPASCP